MKRKVLFLFALIFAIFVMHVSAQTTSFLSSTSQAHPYKRYQWTLEQCKAWQAKYGPIKGINCPRPPSPAVSYQEVISECARLGFNSVRWWPASSVHSSKTFIDAVEERAQMCAAVGMTVSPVFGFTYAFFGKNGDDEASLQKLLQHVREITRHFRGDDRIVLWDIWNEPPMHDPQLTPRYMEWIEAMVRVMQEEGCTQPITASIVWDAEIAACKNTSDPLILRRNKTEMMMDLHNFHDYNVQEGFGAETQAMVDRFRRMDQRPLVCTECMTRTNGSTMQRTLTDFSKHHINFYSWGLHVCDANWEIKWHRSNFYNWEPMFHNLYYADSDPYNPAELDFVKNFHFAEKNEITDPGAEYTEVWSPRRAWRRQAHAPYRGVVASTLRLASNTVSTYAGDYNLVVVPVSYRTYKNNVAQAIQDLSSLLRLAEEKKVSILPILFQNTDFSADNASQMASYAYELVQKFYSHRSIAGWCIMRQVNAAFANQVQDALPVVMRKVRYAFPNQPIFCSPMLVDGAPQDIAQMMWKMSDVYSIAMGSAAVSPNQWIKELAVKHPYPVYIIGLNQPTALTDSLQVSWAVPLSVASEMHHSPSACRFVLQPHSERWDGWEVYRWMNREPTVGVCAASLEDAFAKSRDVAAVVNSLCIQLDCRTYMRDKQSYLEQLTSLLNQLEKSERTVLFSFLDDDDVALPQTLLLKFVEDVVGTFAKNRTVIGWELYRQPGLKKVNLSSVRTLTKKLFSTVRALQPVQPVFITPAVRVKDLPADFDYIQALTHSKGNGGWDRLDHCNADVNLTYELWCQSDVISFCSNQSASQLGWLISQANKFGRPLFCTKWLPVDEVSSLQNFADMHVHWYKGTDVDSSLLKNYHFIPISTSH